MRGASPNHSLTFSSVARFAGFVLLYSQHGKDDEAARKRKADTRSGHPRYGEGQGHDGEKRLLMRTNPIVDGANAEYREYAQQNRNSNIAREATQVERKRLGLGWRSPEPEVMTWEEDLKDEQ